MREYYIRAQSGDEIYALNKRGDQIYAGTGRLDKKYAQKRDGQFYYAKDRDHNEYYTWHQKEQIFIKDRRDDRQVYARSATGRQVYPRTREGREIVAKHADGTPYYARDEWDNEIPPKDERGREVAPFHPLDRYGVPRYLVDESGESVFPRDPHGDEYYLLRHPADGSVIFGSGARKYARRASGDEYYPKTGEVATGGGGGGVPVYARDRAGGIVYKTNEHGDEIYFAGAQLPDFATRYAKRASGREIYPVHPTRLHEYPISAEKYAKDARRNEYYPVDCNGNEYVIRHALLDDYPIANDNSYIVPESEKGQPLLALDSRIVEREDIVGLLYRPCVGGYRDFITDRKNPKRKSRSKPKTYQIFKLNIPSQMNVVYLSILFIIVMLFTYFLQ